MKLVENNSSGILVEHIGRCFHSPVAYELHGVVDLIRVRLVKGADLAGNSF